MYYPPKQDTDDREAQAGDAIATFALHMGLVLYADTVDTIADWEYALEDIYLEAAEGSAAAVGTGAVDIAEGQVNANRVEEAVDIAGTESMLVVDVAALETHGLGWELSEHSLRVKAHAEGCELVAA